jgi:ribonuclease R
MNAILAEYGLPYNYPVAVEQAAEQLSAEISAEEIAVRKDFRGVTTMTIDPDDAKDFDDALSIRPVGEGLWEVGVHIADVSHYVTEGSVIDKEAFKRATSIYLVDRTIPMLPERLCNDLCSLRPHEDKLCFSAVFTINENAEILDEWFGRTVIHSDRRFAYEEAQEVIETGLGDYNSEIIILHTLAQQLRAARFKSGAIAFARDEVRFILDEQGRPTGVYTKVQKEANQLIEEFMLLANRRVAEYCAYRVSNGRRVPRPMVFRVHDEPSEEKLSRFREFALRFGHYFKASKGRAVAKEMNKLLNNIAGSAESNAITSLAVRSMAKAVYTTDNIGHYGLAFPYYTHFTSPIRRYPDMMVHRLLASYLAGEKRGDKRLLEQQCVHSTEREILASEAERASIKYKMAEFMKDHIGEEFSGTVSGMTEWGIYVELDETHVEGMAFLRDIDEDDYYRFDEARYEVVGRNSGITLTLGSPVRVKVKRVDMNRRTLDFQLLL